MSIDEAINNNVINIINKTLPSVVEDAVRKVMGKQTLTTAQVEDQYGLSPSKQCRLRKKKKISYIQDGGKILYRRTSIEDYLEDYTVKGDY